MLDLKWIRDNPDALDAALARRGAEPLAAAIMELDKRHRGVTTELQTLQSRRNDVSKQIGNVKAKGGDAQLLMDEVAAIKDQMSELEATERKLGEEVRGLLLTIPNITHVAVPVGKDETSNVEIRREGTAPTFDFQVKDHK